MISYMARTLSEDNAVNFFSEDFSVYEDASQFAWDMFYVAEAK